jgi:hypothetical protein
MEVLADGQTALKPDRLVRDDGGEKDDAGDRRFGSQDLLEERDPGEERRANGRWLAQ